MPSVALPFTTTCAYTDPLTISLGINGSNIIVLDTDVCQTLGVLQCDEDSVLTQEEDIAG